VSSPETMTLVNAQSSDVTIIIPCLAEYVGIARLAILGVANRLSFSYDEVEDVRLAVGEACGQSIERAAEYSASLVAQGKPAFNSQLKIVSSVVGTTLTISIIDAVPSAGQSTEDSSMFVEGIDYQKLGAVLIEILVDEVAVTETESGTTVKLVKSAASIN
jgi:serine/threonine-protein kinase RsbW